MMQDWSHLAYSELCLNQSWYSAIHVAFGFNMLVGRGSQEGGGGGGGGGCVGGASRAYLPSQFDQLRQ